MQVKIIFAPLKNTINYIIMSKSGVVAQVIGPVVDVSFAASNEGLPKILLVSK
jgi:hypothetical protein